MLKEESWNPKYELWKKAWELLRQRRVHFFFWTVLKQRLLTNAERAKRGLAEDPSCLICGHASEDILHVTRNCTLAKEVNPNPTAGKLFGLLAWRLWKNHLFIFQGKSWSSEEKIKTSESGLTLTQMGLFEWTQGLQLQGECCATKMESGS
ncbi:hypothetical protein Goari_006313 [Gossypium aridum]|uniref:Reverse transcriptase zinc-binding domain-containing protein n=1 Tax=Gossypium aridum TaxID=34290 RepID=A0A7J8XML1_GOSAI|nr:hypothetical protein [Gossypium aridum]